jgi:hypothetical protein
MLVREQNAVQSFGRAANLRQPFTNLFRTEARVDQQPGITGF